MSIKTSLKGFGSKIFDTAMDLNTEYSMTLSDIGDRLSYAVRKEGSESKKSSLGKYAALGALGAWELFTGYLAGGINNVGKEVTTDLKTGELVWKTGVNGASYFPPNSGKTIILPEPPDRDLVVTSPNLLSDTDKFFHHYGYERPIIQLGMALGVPILGGAIIKGVKYLRKK